MASTPITRRSIMGAMALAPLAAAATAAVATPVQPDRAKWDRRLKRYTILRALSDADGDFGTLARAIEAGKLARYEVEAEYGSWARARAHEVGAARCDSIYATETAADEAHYRDYFNPSDRAACLLAMTPAPDLEAALYKIELIKKESLDNHNLMSRDVMEIVHEDMARLAKQGGE